MNNYIHRFTHYLTYRFRAKNAFGIHSPFVYNLYSFLSNNRQCAFQVINKLYRDVLRTIGQPEIKTELQKTIGISTLKHDIRKISVPPHHAVVPYLFVQYTKPQTILELGTGYGLSALCLQTGAPEAQIYTIDHDNRRLAVADYLFRKFRITTVHLHHTSFADFFRTGIHYDLQPDFVFIDGDHRGEKLIEYVVQLLPCIRSFSVIMLHDIYWSPDMTAAWKKLIQIPEVTISIDLFNFGVLVFRRGMQKQHFQLLM